jgi:uncharacterized damage-inducible protein DinB
MIVDTDKGVAEASGRPAAEATILADELTRLAEGEVRSVPSLAELMDDLSAERAAARPIAAAHTIWELVLHVTAWTDVYRRRLEGEAVEEPEAGDYPPVPEPTAERWDEARARLRAGHQRLAETVARLGVEGLEGKVPLRDYSARFQVLSAMQHVLYHAGQIGLLKKAR